LALTVAGQVSPIWDCRQPDRRRRRRGRQIRCYFGFIPALMHVLVAQMREMLVVWDFRLI